MTPTPTTHWSRIQERGSIWGLRFTVACYRSFGRMLALPLIHAVVAYFFLTDRKGRAASQGFLRRVHARLCARGERPDWVPNLGESFRHYREFALSIVDRVDLWGGRAEDFHFRFRGREHFEKLSREGRGAVLLGAHLGSFDALRVLSAQDGVTVNVLMYTRHAPKINEVFRSISPDVDLRVIRADPGSARTSFEIKACIERGEWVAILADRVEPGDRGRLCEVEFLGRPAVLPQAPFLLPLVLGCPAILILALRSGSRRYEVFADPLAVEEAGRERGLARAARGQALAQAYASRLEHHVLRAPRQWFNFYDFWAKEARA